MKKILCFIYRNRNNVKEFFAGIVDEECANKKEKKEKKRREEKEKKEESSNEESSNESSEAPKTSRIVALRLKKN